MREFLGTRFTRPTNVAAIVNFGKKRPNVNICLAAFLILLVASPTGAMSQKASNMSVLNSLFINPSNSTSKNLAIPSPSCFSRQACITDANFQQEFTSFVNFIHSRYPSAQVPSAERLQRHACNTLSPGGSHSTDDLGASNPEGMKMGQWLATYLNVNSI